MDYFNRYSQQYCVPYSSTLLQSPTFWCPLAISGSPPLFLLFSSLRLAEETRSSSAWWWRSVIFGRRVLQGPYWPQVSADHSRPSCHQGAVWNVRVLPGFVLPVIAPGGKEVLASGALKGHRWFLGENKKKRYNRS